jgi:outer membrane immunogenic protein
MAPYNASKYLLTWRKCHAFGIFHWDGSHAAGTSVKVALRKLNLKEDYMRRTTFGAAAGIVCIASMASAADFPVKAPPPAPAPVPFSWTGFYAGVNGGGSWGQQGTDFAVAGIPVGSASHHLDGWLGGGQIGYNWQTLNWQNLNWVFGLEADIQGSSQKGTVNFAHTMCVGAACTTGTEAFEHELPWFGTARGRVGVLAPGDRWLVYATGGLAYGEIESNLSSTLPAVPTATSFNQTRAGWTVGGGVEWAWLENWSGKIEYLYMDLGKFDQNFATTGPFGLVGTNNSRVTDNIVRVGINYRFTPWTTPAVVSRY